MENNREEYIREMEEMRRERRQLDRERLDFEKEKLKWKSKNTFNPFDEGNFIERCMNHEIDFICFECDIKSVFVLMFVAIICHYYFSGRSMEYAISK